MKKRITTKFIMENGPCPDYPEHRVSQLIGRGKTPLEILDMDIPAVDRIWVITRSGVMSKKECVEFAIACAKRSLKNFESIYPDDNGPRNAIRAAAAWLRNPTEQNRKRAAWSAVSAERSAARSAAKSAAWSAWSAERSAAWSAVSAESAAWSAAWSAVSAERSAAWSAVSAESAAWSAESAASAERSAAWSAERDKQIKDLRRIIKRRAQ